MSRRSLNNSETLGTGPYATPRRPTAVIFGDSHEATAVARPEDLDVANMPGGRGWWNWCNAYLGQHFKLLFNAGVGGNTTTQMLARIQTDVIAYDPSWVFMGGGANDIAGDVSSATTIANLTAMLGLLSPARTVVLLTPPPSANYSTTARKAAFNAIYKWMMETVPTTYKNVIVADRWRATVDPATGFHATGYTFDNVHHSIKGGQAAGLLVANTIEPMIPKHHNFTKFLSAADPDNILSNPGFGTSGTGWAAFGTGASAAFSAMTDRPQNQADITITGVTDNVERGITHIEAAGLWAVGDVVQAVARISWDGATAVSGAGGKIFQPFLRLYPRRADGTFGPETLAMFTAGAEEVNSVDAPASGEIVVKTPRLTMTSSTGSAYTNLYMAVGWSGMAAGNVHVKELAVYKGASA